MLVRFNTDDVVIHLAAAGAGKAGWVDAIIPTPLGPRRFGDLKTGDYVFNREGFPTMVLGVYPQGVIPSYKVTLRDGRSTICSGEHLWGVYTEGHRGKTYKVMTLNEMIAKGIRKKVKRPGRVNGQAKFYVPASGPHRYNSETKLPVDPYVMGVFIGNGCLRYKYLSLSSNDVYTVDKVASILKAEWYKNSVHNYNYQFKKDGRVINTKDIFASDVRHYSQDKYVPQEYMTASIEDRKALLQGLFDTDGCATTDGVRLHVSYSTISETLATQIRQLLLSIGISSTICVDKRDKYINSDGKCYSVHVHTTKENKAELFSLPRKKNICLKHTKKEQRNYDMVPVLSVEPAGDREMMCIYVGNEEHLYLCEDSIVTHNTTVAMNEITDALHTYRPDEVAFVSFTRNGVETGIKRALEQNPDLTPDDLCNFKTLHALSFREAKLTKANIMTAQDIIKFNKAFGFNISPNPDTFGHSTEDDKLLQRYDSERAGATKGIFVNGAFDSVRYDRLVNAYKAFKQAHNLVDFQDCMEKYLENGEPLQGVKVFINDEAQDTTPIQWRVIMKMTENAERIRILGDDFQTIFEHSGSDPAILVELAAHYKCKKHEVSYRLPVAVYNYAKKITDLISVKVDKKYEPKKGAVEGFVEKGIDRDVLARKIRDDLRKNGVRSGRWYLLFRTNCFIDDMAEMLRQFIIPYSDQRGFCIDKRAFSRIKRYYQYRVDGYGTKESRDKFMAEYNIKNFDDEFIYSDLVPGKERYFYQDLVNEYGLELLEKIAHLEKPFCLLSTIHKVKGGEADFTGLFMDCTKVVSENMLLDIDSELRVLYVGATRCKKGLYIVNAKGTYSMQKLLDLVEEV